MAILVDEARWTWRGARWAHLVSDRSHDELHEFAAGLGKRRLGFQGDHYDVDELDRDRAIELGARVVDSRTLVRRLRAAGLRVRDGKPTWEQVGSWPEGRRVPALPAGVGAVLDRVETDLVAARVALFEDAVQQALLVDLAPGQAVVVAPDPQVLLGGARADGWRSLEIFVPRPKPTVVARSRR